MRVALILPYTSKDRHLAEDAARSFKSATQLRLELHVVAVGDGTEQRLEAADSQFSLPECRGVTAAWNIGLQYCDQMRMDVAIIGNADTVWGAHAIDGLVSALHEGLDLVGPVSNRPGWGSKLQEGSPKELRDEWVQLAPLKLAFDHRTRCGVGMMLDQCINGFTMAALMDTWAAGAFDLEAGHFFNPAYKQTENEMELQLRWALLDWKIGVALGSYVHHYKGVFEDEDFHYRDSRFPGEPSRRPVSG